MGVLRDSNIAQLYWHLREGAQRCIKAADLQGEHPSALEDWLGPTEELLQHASSRDLELMLQLRQFIPDWLLVRPPSAQVVQCQCVNMSNLEPSFCVHIAALDDLALRVEIYTDGWQHMLRGGGAMLFF